MEKCIGVVLRSIRGKLLVPGLMISVFSSLAQPLDFSIKLPAPNGWNPADVIAPLGDSVVIPAADLGLPAGTDLNSFSFGTDEIEPLGPFNWVRLAYSVTTGSSGIRGAVFVEAMPAGNGAGGDTFDVRYVRVQAGAQVFFVSAPPMRLLDAEQRRLTPRAPGPETELDGLSLQLASIYPIYFTVQGAPGMSPADIFVVTNRGGPPQVFARSGDLGLLPGDTIDALAIRGPGGGAPLALGNGVVVWVSLAGRLPAVSTGPEDGVFQVFPGPPALAVPGSRLDLRFGDEIDAIAGLDPGPIDPPILIGSVVPREGVSLILFGESGANYTIQRAKSLTETAWADWRTGKAVEGRVEVFDEDAPSAAIFYRARREAELPDN